MANNKKTDTTVKLKDNWFLKLLDGEKSSRIAIPVFSVLISLVVASVFMILLGKNPFTALAAFLRGCGLIPKPNYAGGQGMITDFMTFLDILSPMLLASLGVIIAMKAGLFNIGIAGQMLLAGFTATVFVGYSGLGSWIAKPMVIIVGVVVGGLVGALIGFLKYRFNIHEVVSSIMLNYIISYVTGFFINTYYADQISRQSKVISNEARLTFTGVPLGSYKIRIPLGIIIAIIMVFAVRFLMDRTTTGLRIQTVGENRNCAEYAGINVGKNMVLAMFLSGILAGLAGVTYYLGYFNSIVPKDLAGLGYDSIAVSLLGNTNPVGAIFASILVTIFQNGSVYMSSTIGVPKEIASVITGIILLFSACGAYIKYLAHRRRTTVKSQKGEK